MDRPIVALAAVIVSGIAPLSVATAASVSPLLWNDVQRLSVQCDISGGTAPQRAELCARILAAAAVNAPMPVDAITEDAAPALPAPGQALLHLSGKINESGAFAGSLQTAIQSVRTETKPHVKRVPIALAFGQKPIKVTGPINAAISELLPWRALRPALRKPPPRQY